MNNHVEQTPGEFFTQRYLAAGTDFLEHDGHVKLIHAIMQHDVSGVNHLDQIKRLRNTSKPELLLFS